MAKNDKKTSSFMEEVSVIGKVSYNDYINYLSTKSDDEIKEIYIEQTLNLRKREKVNSLIGFSAVVSLSIRGGVLLQYDYREKKGILGFLFLDIFLI